MKKILFFIFIIIAFFSFSTSKASADCICTNPTYGQTKVCNDPARPADRGTGPCVDPKNPYVTFQHYCCSPDAVNSNDCQLTPGQSCVIGPCRSDQEEVTTASCGKDRPGVRCCKGISNPNFDSNGNPTFYQACTLDNPTCPSGFYCSTAPISITGYACIKSAVPTAPVPCLSWDKDSRCLKVGTGLNISIGTTPLDLIKSIFSVVLSLSGGIAILLIILSGYRILASQGNPEALKGAREQLTAAIVGLLFIIFSLVILQIIGYDILNLPSFGIGHESGGSFGTPKP